MDWIDTLMLETNHSELSISGDRLAESATAKPAHAVSARLVAVHGISLLQAEGRTHHEAAAALELLRGFRATGRRVVFCDTSCLIAGRQLGSEMVESGSANVLVSCGKHGRDLAIGARDAGLDLTSVIVCKDSHAASEVLACRLIPGDTVLLWGVASEVCDSLIAKIESRLSSSRKIAA